MRITLHHAWAAGAMIASAAFLCPLPAAAQQGEHPDTDGIFTVSFENDIFAGEDNNYTNGVRFSYVSPENDIPGWLDRTADALPFFTAEGNKRWQLSAGQSMFTPSDTLATAALPDDRPYAGWLYGSLGVVADHGNRLDNVQLTVGIVGPASGAEDTQNFIHDLIDSDKAKGWNHQLKNELGVALSVERKWRSLYEFTPLGWGLDVTPSLGASVGNVYTHASAGAMVRFGYDLPADYGPPIIPPALGGSDFFVPSSDFGWYVFAGFEGRAVALNIFLDGNTFTDSPSVDKEPLVGGLQVGLAVTVYETRIAYTHVFRTREFKTQHEDDSYGALTVSWRF